MMCGARPAQLPLVRALLAWRRRLRAVQSLSSSSTPTAEPSALPRPRALCIALPRVSVRKTSTRCWGVAGGAGRNMRDGPLMPLPARDTQPPELVGPYILGKTIGRGACGKVKQGWHKDTHLEVMRPAAKRGGAVLPLSARARARRVGAFRSR